MLYFDILIKIGDVLSVYYASGPFVYHFKGICMTLQKKSQIKKTSNLTLRNVYYGIGIELLFGLISNCIFKIVRFDYEKKKFMYNKAKLLYLRRKINRESSVI